MLAADLAGVRWTTSSYSGGNGNCVEVAMGVERTGVRDSKDRDGGLLLVSAGSWASFLAATKSGHHDR